MANVTETPLMKQYQEMKAKHPDAILLFRVGDFYEIFSDDAIIASEILGITLTRRTNGNAKCIELAGFPHHALDSYLPRLIRAGKRVAICEQLEDKPKVVEKITPAEDKPKPEPVKSAIKHIGCEKDLREKGEPIAWFTVDIPKEAKNLNKCVNLKNERTQLASICLIPENGKLYASDTRILQSVLAQCSGEWPAGIEKEIGGKIYYQPFQCNIDPKAINHLAGKTVDVAVWQDENGQLDVTACEATGVLTQFDETIRRGVAFPDAERVLTSPREVVFKVADDQIRPMAEWVKKHMGKATPDRYGDWDRNNRVKLHVTPDADTIQLCMYERDETGEYVMTQEAVFGLSEVCEVELTFPFIAPLFHLSIDGDFNGEIQAVDSSHSVNFMGAYRTSALMPMIM